MPNFENAVIEEIIEQRPGLQRVKTSRGNAYALTEIIGAVAIDDAVVLNTTAVDLDLGTGGWHVVHWNLSTNSNETRREGHIIKGRYLSEQSNTVAVEESNELPDSLGGTPVVVCGLHSQLPLVVAAALKEKPDLRIAYVMTDTGALPYALSDTCWALTQKKMISVAISAGQAFGAPYEAVNVASAMAFAKLRGADIIVVAPGVGITGTGSKLGFSSLSNANELNLADSLGGKAMLVVRYSEADERNRHRGISHHTETILELTKTNPIVAVPAHINATVSADTHEVEVPDCEVLLKEFGLEVSTMGRSVADDPGFFAFAAAAGVCAAQVAI